MEAEKPDGRRQVLHLILSQPRRIGRQIEGHGWKEYTFLKVYFVGEHMKEKRVRSPLLPDEHDDVKPWKRHYEFEVDGGWQHLCLHLEAVREDYDVDEDTGSVEVLRTDEPHTSGCTAAIGAAQVRTPGRAGARRRRQRRRGGRGEEESPESPRAPEE
uniref:Uncharacterized protein n=1 Tax=Aegilops tauschii TaxID=37682 RepID=M8BX54_AEGTA